MPRQRERASKILARSAPPQRSEALARYQAALKLAGEPSTRRKRLRQELSDMPPAPGSRASGGPRPFGNRRQGARTLCLATSSTPIAKSRLTSPRFPSPLAAARSSRACSPKRPPRRSKLRRAEGVEDTLLRSEIDELRSTGKSLMPEGLEQNINLQEMADLIAFLREGR